MTATINTNTNAWFKSLQQELSYALTNSINFARYFEPLLQPINPMWSADDYRAQVIEIREESHNCYSLSLKPSKKWPGFEPGQFVELKIIQEGAELSRCFSISSSRQLFQEQGLIELSIREQDKGRVTPWIKNNIKASHVVGLSAAMGEFIIENRQRPILMIAGGSGITPFRSFMTTQSELYPHPQSQLMYYASQDGNHLFADELLSIESKSITSKLISTQKQGRFTKRHLKQYCPDFLDHDIYICGPNAMIANVKSQLIESGVKEEHIFIEHFGPAPSDLSNIDTGGKVHFLQTQKKIDSGNADSLLALAEDNSINAEAGCRMGVCHKCKCKKKSGVVYNTLTQSYSDTGEEDIQLCVSVPVGDVTLNL